MTTQQNPFPESKAAASVCIQYLVSRQDFYNISSIAFLRYEAFLLVGILEYCTGNSIYSIPPIWCSTELELSMRAIRPLRSSYGFRVSRLRYYSHNSPPLLGIEVGPSSSSFQSSFGYGSRNSNKTFNSFFIWAKGRQHFSEVPLTCHADARHRAEWVPSVANRRDAMASLLLAADGPTQLQINYEGEGSALFPERLFSLDRKL